MPEDLHQEFPTEDELKDGLGTVRTHGVGVCPTRAVLEDFVAGEYAQDETATEKVLAHLADCDVCEGVLAQIRVELSQPKMRRERLGIHRWPAWKLGFALFSVAILLTTWFMLTRHRDLSVATLDLRHITRGVESSPSPGQLTLPKNLPRLRVFLPIGSVGGTYEAGLFLQGAAIPLVSGFAETVSDKDSLVINIHFAARAIPPGSYLLGIRLKESEWIYYPIIVE